MTRLAETTAIPSETHAGVEGNARLTGMAGAALFVVLALEGITILQVRQLVSVHVFIGMLLVPLALLKTGSTTYRFAQYYRGQPDYRRKGPPASWLRLIGPLVVVTSLVVLGTGIATVLAGSDVRWVRDVHKISFFVWFVLMAAHVLGHIRETPALASADLRGRAAATRVVGFRVRAGLVIVAVLLGLTLGVVALGWVGTWR